MKSKFITKSNKFAYKFFSKQFSNELNLPIVDVAKYLKKSQGWESECKLVSDCFNETGVLAIRDPVRIFF